MIAPTKLLALGICLLSVAVLNQFCFAAPITFQPSPTTTVTDLSETTSDVTTTSSETTVASEETTPKDEETGLSTVGQATVTEESPAGKDSNKNFSNPQSVKPTEPTTTAKPDPSVTIPNIRTTKKSNTKAPVKPDDKRNEATAKITTMPPTTSKLTTATTKSPLTTHLATTTSMTTTKATTQQPTTTAPKKETQAPVAVQTTHPVTQQHPVVTLPLPVVVKTQPPPARTTLAPSTQKPQPVKTEEPHQGDHEDGDHLTHSPVTSNPESNKNDTDNSWLEKFSHNSLVSKLMLPVILGVVAAFVIVCFAYGVRACRKNKSRGRRKMMTNGQDHDMSTNFDRVKLLADSSEDEF